MPSLYHHSQRPRVRDQALQPYSLDVHLRNSFQFFQKGHQGGSPQGNNKEEKKVPMTAPVVTDAILSSGSPSCYNSSFVVRLHMPKQFRDSPPATMDDMELHPHLINSRCTVVRAFGGFTSDQNIKEEAKKLKETLVGTSWGTLLRSNFTNECLSKDVPFVFTVAQYNSPFNNVSRVNEAWLTLDDSKCSI
ncbi:hypothetical protein SUGI_0099170 [Cryptomeria japonica]|nr:hypothetical protein SUGI_0099170 [Cryptomeria japonica]